MRLFSPVNCWRQGIALRARSTWRWSITSTGRDWNAANSSSAPPEVLSGRSEANAAYHWEHRKISAPRLALFDAYARLVYAYLRQWPGDRSNGPVPERHIQALMRLHSRTHYLRVRKQPRNYARHGLAPLATGGEGS